jgi:uncharacterized ion transporter superfamily protein YfcC
MNNEDTDKNASQSLISGCGRRLVLVLMVLYFLVTIYSTIFAIWSFFLGINAGFQGRDTLFCNRVELSKIDCKVVRNSFLREQTEIIKDVKKAEVRITKVRGQGKLKTYRYNYQIFLVTKSGLYTLFYPEDYFEPQNTEIFKSEVSQINNFINDSDENSLKIEEKEYALSSIKRGIFLLFIGWLPWMIFFVYFYIVLITLKPTGRKS